MEYGCVAAVVAFSDAWYSTCNPFEWVIEIVARIIWGAAVLAISATAIWLAFRSVAWAELYDAAVRMEYQYIPLALLGLFASLLIRTERWRLLLPQERQIRRRDLFSAVMIGYMAISILPFRVGEAARVYAANRIAGVAIADAVAALLIEHVLDLGTLLLLLFWQWPGLKSYQWVQEIYLLGIGILAFSVCVIGGILMFSTKVLLILDRADGIAPRWIVNLGLSSAVSTGIQAVHRLQSPRLLITLMIWSVLTWLFACGFNAGFLRALGVEGVIEGSVLTIILTNFAALIPSTPGYIGVYDLAAVTALSVLGVSSAVALAFALTSHFALLVTFVISGVVAIIANGLGWRSFTADVQSVRNKI